MVLSTFDHLIGVPPEVSLNAALQPNGRVPRGDCKCQFNDHRNPLLMNRTHPTGD